MRCISIFIELNFTFSDLGPDRNSDIGGISFGGKKILSLTKSLTELLNLLVGRIKSSEKYCAFHKFYINVSDFILVHA